MKNTLENSTLYSEVVLTNNHHLQYVAKIRKIIHIPVNPTLFHLEKKWHFWRHERSYELHWFVNVWTFYTSLSNGVEIKHHSTITISCNRHPSISHFIQETWSSRAVSGESNQHLKSMLATGLRKYHKISFNKMFWIQARRKNFCLECPWRAMKSWSQSRGSRGMLFKIGLWCNLVPYFG